MIIEVVEDIDTSYSIDTSEMDIGDRNEVNANASDSINLWNYMMKQQTKKAKYNICGVILSRTHAATSGLGMHLYRVHKIEPFGKASTKSSSKFHQLSIDEKNKLGLLMIKCIIEDGRSFSDIRQSGILKIFNHLVQGKKNTV